MLNTLSLQSAKGLSGGVGTSSPSTGFPANDDFESLANAAAVTATTGGSGWTSAWTDSGSAANSWIATNTSPSSGLISAIFTGNGASKSRTIDRNFAVVNAGTVYTSVKFSEASVSTQVVITLANAVDLRCRVRVAGSGTISIFNLGTVTYEQKFTGLAINTWYRVGVRFDCTAQTTSCNLDGGAFSTTTPMESSINGDITTYKDTGAVLTSGQSVSVDFINPNYA